MPNSSVTFDSFSHAKSTSTPLDPHSAGNAPLRSALANAALAVEDRVVWGAGDLARGFAELIRWPFAADRLGARELADLAAPGRDRALESADPLRRARGGVLARRRRARGSASPACSRRPGPAEAATVSGPSATRAAPASAGPCRRSAPRARCCTAARPDFAPALSAGVPKSGEAEVLTPNRRRQGRRRSGGRRSGAAARASDLRRHRRSPRRGGRDQGRPRFAAAFVLYETGQGGASVRKTFLATATPELTQTLLQRPPRLPANVKVPKAKVLEHSARASAGTAPTLSASRCCGSGRPASCASI